MLWQLEEEQPERQKVQLTNRPKWSHLWGPLQACDDASIMKMEEMAKGMTDPAMKDKMEMAMKEVEMAKMSMKDNKADDCMMHLDNAMKATAQ
jgi:hypothetical protein